MVRARKSPFQTATEKGRLAAIEGHPITANPYKDCRKHDGRLTFSRARRNAWLDGYRMGQSERSNSATT